MAKKYDLDVKPMMEFEGGGNYIGYYSKGHVDPSKFVEIVKHDWEPEFPPTPEKIQHCYWRLVPAGMGDGTMLFKPAHAGARGAFPVTVWDM